MILLFGLAVVSRFFEAHHGRSKTESNESNVEYSRREHVFEAFLDFYFSVIPEGAVTSDEMTPKKWRQHLRYRPLFLCNESIIIAYNSPMYSQYNYYQQPGGGTAVTTTQGGLTWNGTAWVPSATPTSTTHSSYASSNTNKPAADLVQTYTQYYHLWKAQEEQQERLAQSLPEGPAKEEAKRQALWNKHYADQSSIAAHHYNNNPHTAPPTLPPAPPGATAAAPTTCSAVTNTAAPPTALHYQQQPTIGPQPAQQNPPESPDGLKRYVHKCLQQCHSDSQKELMQKEVEKVIQQAIKQGTMHTTNWDSRALLPIPMDTATAVQTSGGTAAAIKRFRQQNANNTQVSSSSSSVGHYGPASSSAASNQVNSGSHYGPASGASNQGNSGHYGPASSANYYGPSSSGCGQEQQQRAAPAPSPADGSYYGPSATTGDNYYGSNTSQEQEDKYKSKWTLQDKFATTTTPSSPQDFVSSNNYYGSNRDLGDDDFVSLSSHKISRKRKKSDKKKEKASRVKLKKQVIMQEGGKDGFERSSSALAKRANRFAGAGGIAEAASLPSTTSKNMDRFMGLALIGGSKKLDEKDYEHMKVKGTCTKLEKEYLRLTAPPRAELVRPESVLKKHLANLKAEWAAPKHREYLWFCSQLKAVRQDLTVQQIVNAFSVDVYETHARIALEEGDLNEYNQCQTQLKELYKTLQTEEGATKNLNEFVAYRLIYYVFLQGNQKYEGGSSDLFNIMLSLTPGQRQDSFISHALKVRAAVAEYDYHAFFRLLKESSRHGACLMKYMVPKVRHWALRRVCKAYRPSVPTEHVLQELGFDIEKDVDFGKKWLVSCGVVLSENGDVVLAKDSVVRESDLTEKASSLI